MTADAENATEGHVAAARAVAKGAPLRLHLGCGATRLDGYVNIDHPASQHSVMDVRPDIEADILDLHFPDESVEEIRLHHVFEHFDRVVALALLLRWRRWLRPGGLLWIETPDFLATAAAAQALPVDAQIALARHIEGDQADSWAYHVGQWFPARFERTLRALGYADIETISERSRWHDLPLFNVTAKARKTGDVDDARLKQAAHALLAESLASPLETATLDVWKRQFDAFADHGALPHGEAKLTPSTVAALVEHWRSALDTTTPIGDIQSFNQNNRDIWVRNRLAAIPAGARVLDVGAGPCPYRADLEHTLYESHDFKAYEGYVDPTRGEGLYGRIDHVSDILALPVADASFDAVLCTEVLEHVPEPIAAIAEMARVLKPGGLMIVTAPLSSGLHQQPYHFYGGFTPHWYRMAAERAGLDVVDIEPNGGFFRHLAQECARVAWTMPRHGEIHADAEAVGTLFGEILPRVLTNLDDRCAMPEFTVGYHVTLRRGT